MSPKIPITLSPWWICLDVAFLNASNELYSVTVFVHWLYHQKLPENNLFWTTLPVSNDDLDCDEIRLKVALQAYVFGDRFPASDFRPANELFVETSDHRYYFCADSGSDLVSYAFENIPADRVILQYLVDQYCEE